MKRQKKRLCRIGIIALIIAVVVFSPIVPCLTKVWLPLQKLSSTLTTRQREGDAVVLRSVDLFLTENVSVTEQIYHHDSPHEVDVYLTPRDCQYLPTYWNTTNLKFKNSTPIYMLAGSRLSYNICASTDSKQKDNIELYIVAGLNNILHFNPDEALEDKHYYYKSIPVGGNGDMPCTKVLQHVHSPNYYASIFLIPPQPLNITYQFKHKCFLHQCYSFRANEYSRGDS